MMREGEVEGEMDMVRQGRVGSRTEGWRLVWVDEGWQEEVEER